ncbi:MAG TPA: FRG domain-containing protein [Phycisphaerae bacterium]|nr:FRG domain-containing protein [Phycisphaerae bacterium]
MDGCPDIVSGIATRTLKSWKDFYALIQNDLENAPAYIFRGQAESEWLVKSSLDRLEERFPTTVNHHGGIPDRFNCPPASREEHLAAFRQSVLHRRGPNPPPLNDRECWALAQHHGLATPMLDWTLSPFVALFFAFEEEFVVGINQEYSPPKNRVVFALSTSVVREHSTGNDPAPCPFIPKNETSNRLQAQSGIFLEMPRNTDLEEYVREKFQDESSSNNPHARAVLHRIVI